MRAPENRKWVVVAVAAALAALVPVAGGAAERCVLAEEFTATW
jgi:hypothetical protein